jgi:hypothetical protein
MKRTPLDIGAKSRKRGSTFSADPTPLKCATSLKAVASSKRGSGFTPASREQRLKVAGRGSIVSGAGPCDPAHLTARAWGGCDDPLCVIPLTRAEHRAFDAGELDILGDLIDHGLWAELAHAIEAHHIDPISLVHRCTGERYVPASEAA